MGCPTKKQLDENARDHLDYSENAKDQFSMHQNANINKKQVF